MKNNNIKASLYALLAAVFYAINIPCSKLLLQRINPTVLAGLLYIGAGLGVGILLITSKNSSEESLNKKDLPYVIAMVVLDIAAPILLMYGISLGNAGTASLLSNFEIVATTLIALFLFNEKVTWRLWIAVALITLSSIVLSIQPGQKFEFSVGSLLVIAATIFWGLENNCTRRLSQKNAKQIVTVKGLCSGTGSLIIAIILGQRFTAYEKTTLLLIPVVLLLGFVSYGLSIFTYIKAQKTLGAAKTSVYYAVAPFVGCLLSFILLREQLTLYFFLALPLMLLGTVFVAYDTIIRQHTHIHTHTYTHTHDNSTHTHTVVHSHDHSHIVSDKVHGHHHSLQELEDTQHEQ